MIETLNLQDSILGVVREKVGTFIKSNPHKSADELFIRIEDGWSNIGDVIKETVVAVGVEYGVEFKLKI